MLHFVTNMEKIDKTGIAQRMREVRKKNNLTQQNIADVLGLSRSVYSRVEVNSYTPNLDHVIAFGIHFQIDLNWLVFGKEAKAKVAEPSAPYGNDSQNNQTQILLKMIDTLENSLKDKDTIIAFQKEELMKLKQKPQK